MNTLSRTQETFFFQNPTGKIYYNTAGYVRLAWGPERISLDVLQAYYEKALALLLTMDARQILSEHGQRVPLSVRAQEWLLTDWIPRAMSQARVHHCAVVEGLDPLHRLSTQSVISAAPAGFVFKRFHSVEEAEAWLRTLPR